LPAPHGNGLCCIQNTRISTYTGIFLSTNLTEKLLEPARLPGFLFCGYLEKGL